MDKTLDSNFLNLARERSSIRKFIDKPVERDKIEQCVEAARLAPSAENVQPWRFVVVDDPGVKQKLAEDAFAGVYKYTRWAGKAPVLIAICAKLDIIANRIGKQIQGTSYYLIDIGIAGEHFVLQAQELGLGTCWIGWFNEKKTRKLLCIPRNMKVAALIAMGYPDPNYKRIKPKLSLEEIIHYNKYK